MPPLPPDALFMQLAMGRWISQSLGAAAQLGIADLISSEPVPVIDLAVITNTQPEALYRLLRALASVGVFVEARPRAFALTPIAECLRRDSPHSMRNMAMMLNDDWQLDGWKQLADCVRTGNHARHAGGATGEALFAMFTENPKALEIFQGAMSDMSRGASKAVLAAYDFTGIDTLADIAGGHGLILTDILRANPALKGMLFERAEVIEGAKAGPYVKDVESRLRFESGDFFKAVSPGADAYLMKHILHDWNDELAIKILKNIRAVIPATGRLLLIESVIPPGNDPHPAKWIDLEMLVSPGGKERTEEEWKTLLASGGFNLTRVIPTRSLFCVIEAKSA